MKSTTTSKKVTVTGPQPTSFGAKTSRYSRRAPTDLLWCKKVTLLTRGPNRSFRCANFCSKDSNFRKHDVAEFDIHNVVAPERIEYQHIDNTFGKSPFFRVGWEYVWCVCVMPKSWVVYSKEISISSPGFLYFSKFHSLSLFVSYWPNILPFVSVDLLWCFRHNWGIHRATFITSCAPVWLQGPNMADLLENNKRSQKLRSVGKWWRSFATIRRTSLIKEMDIA